MSTGLLCAIGLCACWLGFSSHTMLCGIILSSIRHCTVTCTSNLRACGARLVVLLWRDPPVMNPRYDLMSVRKAERKRNEQKHSLLCVSAAKQNCQATGQLYSTHQHMPCVKPGCLFPGMTLPLSVLACAIRGTFYIQYETLEELGEGAFGKALKCRRRRDNQIFVVKIMHESKMSAKAIEEVTSIANLLVLLTCHMTSHAANSSSEQKQAGGSWFQMHRAWIQRHFLTTSWALLCDLL